MCIVSTVSSVRVVGNVSVCGVNKVELRRKKNFSKMFLKDCDYLWTGTDIMLKIERVRV